MTSQPEGFNIGGISLQARPLPLLILADVSGSMHGAKIGSMSQALRDLVEDLRSDEQTSESVLVSVITFGGAVTDVCRLEPVRTMGLSTFTSNGDTPMGEAFRSAIRHLADRQRLPERCLEPVIVLTSDGQPTDDWQEPLEELKSHPRAGRGLRIALAIGDDADTSMLEHFVTTEYPVLRADEPHKIRTFFSRVVTWETKQASRSQGLGSVRASVDDLDLLS